MRRFQICVLVIAAAWVSVVSAQGMKIANLDDYRKAMQSIGANFGGAFKAIGSGNLADAKTGVTNAKATMQSVHAFFEERKKDDLAMLAKDAVDKLTAAETALGGTDAAAATAAVKVVGGACGACHMKYRDGDGKATPFSFKPGTI